MPRNRSILAAVPELVEGFLRRSRNARKSPGNPLRNQRAGSLIPSCLCLSRLRFAKKVLDCQPVEAQLRVLSEVSRRHWITELTKKTNNADCTPIQTPLRRRPRPRAASRLHSPGGLRKTLRLSLGRTVDQRRCQGLRVFERLMVCANERVHLGTLTRTAWTVTSIVTHIKLQKPSSRRSSTSYAALSSAAESFP
jgi:hypothetical protein